MKELSRMLLVLAAVVATTLSLSSCASAPEIRYVQTKLEYDPAPRLPTLGAVEFLCVEQLGGMYFAEKPPEDNPEAELQCNLMVISDATYEKMVERDSLRREDAATLRATIDAHNAAITEREEGSSRRR